MVGDESQQQGTAFSPEYCTRAKWVSCPRTTSAPSRHRFLGGALLNLASRHPYAVSRFTSNDLRQQVALMLKTGSFDLLVSDFLFPSSSLPWLSKTASGIPWILFQHNVESLIWERRARGRNKLTTAYWRSQWQRMKRFEQDACSRFDGIITVSEEDARIHREDMGLANVLGTAPTGVDIDYFTALPRTPAAKPTVIFVGSMDWMANVDAVHFFVADVWPQVRHILPEARFQIVGRQPPASIRALADTATGIEVTGTVPDVRPYMRQAHAMVVPLRIGGGTRLKIFEAMAAQLPVISTHIGAEGLPVSHGRHLLLANASADIAQAVIEVITTPALADNLRTHAFNEMALPHSWEAASQVFESFCLQKLGTS
jgi:glycosyltransferase involved in cell wall biosynthesis